MLVPLSWLKKYVDIDVSMKDFEHELTMTGSIVEEIIKLGDNIENVVVGKILSIDQHPNADKLVICIVDVGDKQITIVTGADNMKAGDLIPVAVAPSVLPNGMKIKKGKLRGVESEGMLCSGEELNLTNADYPGAEVYGIMILTEDYKPGMDIAEALILDDTVIEFELTPNRPDCLSIIGIARETAVTLDTALKLPEISVNESGGDINDYIAVRIDDADLCKRYGARVVKDIKIEPSPMWMRRALSAAGVRPINNIVDITNYVMLEMGQPMHAFDISCIDGRQIIVRRAYKDEEITTLDGQTRKLDTEMLVIADEKKAVALGGVMGGANSEITEDTTDILLEAAWFDPSSINRTSGLLELKSEASSRFERGLDIENAIPALNRAAQLIADLGAGKVVCGIVDCYPVKSEKRVITVKWQRINELLGLTLTADDIAVILEKLEFAVNVDGDDMTVKIPSFRGDIEGAADLAEEVVRIYGFDNIPETLMPGTISKGSRTRKQKLRAMVRDLLAGTGLYEASTTSFEGDAAYDKMGISKPPIVELLNPLGRDQSYMRTSLVPSLLNVLSHNYNRQQPVCEIFEMACVYIPKSLPLTELPDEIETLTMAVYGNGCDYLYLKGKLDLLLNRLGLKADYTRLQHVSYHPGRTASVLIDGVEIGILGELHPKIASNFDIGADTVICELDFGKMLKMAVTDREYVQLPKVPAVNRDLAIMIDVETPAIDVIKLIEKNGGKILEDVKLFDVYQGEQIPEGYKSMAFSIIYRGIDRTLKDKEVTKQHSKIVKALEREFEAKLR